MIPTTGHCLWEPPLTYNSYRVPLVCTIGPPLIPSAQREAALNTTPMQPTGGDLRSARQKPNEIASEYRGCLPYAHYWSSSDFRVLNKEGSPKPSPNATDAGSDLRSARHSRTKSSANIGSRQGVHASTNIQFLRKFLQGASHMLTIGPPLISEC